MAAYTCTTFLSKNVASLIQETYSAHETFETAEELPLDVAAVVATVGCPTEQWTAQDYRSAIKLMSGLFQQIADYFQAYHTLSESLRSYLQWTQNEKLFDHIYSLLRHPEQHVTSVPLGILLCSAALERALGNVYLMRGSQVPSLMKDLLASQELKQIFGKEIVTGFGFLQLFKMALLQIIIGPPLSLNIRNILWHGFASPEEIPVHLGFFLFSLVLHLGKALETQGVEQKDLPFRALSNFERIDCLKGVFPDFYKVDHIAILERLFASSRFIPEIMLLYWQGALAKFEQNSYGEFLVLLIPQLEHSLRCLFTAANNCPVRMLTAESAEFYTTFDEILATSLSTGESNKLIVDFDNGEQFLSTLLDILAYPDGPRIRDRVSHGELEVAQIPHVLANHVLGISTAFCIKLLPSNHPLKEDILLNDVSAAIHNYKPIFHPSATVSSLVQDLVENCSKWTDCQSALQSDVIEAMHVAVSNQTVEWQDILIKLLRAENLEAVIVEMKIALHRFQCKTLNRPRWEWEALLQMKRILNGALTTGTQTLLNIQERSGMIEQRQLRSRQRATYQRMLACIPTIKAVLLVVSVIMCISLISINKFGESDSKERERKKRFLNCIEKCSDNLRTLTNQTKNRWEESKEVVLNLLFPDVCKYYRQHRD